jgi:hypothetical protein
MRERRINGYYDALFGDKLQPYGEKVGHFTIVTTVFNRISGFSECA